MFCYNYVVFLPDVSREKEEKLSSIYLQRLRHYSKMVIRVIRHIVTRLKNDFREARSRKLGMVDMFSASGASTSFVELAIGRDLTEEKKAFTRWLTRIYEAEHRHMQFLRSQFPSETDSAETMYREWLIAQEDGGSLSGTEASYCSDQEDEWPPDTDRGGRAQLEYLERYATADPGYDRMMNQNGGYDRVNPGS